MKKIITSLVFSLFLISTNVHTDAQKSESSEDLLGFEKFETLDFGPEVYVKQGVKIEKDTVASIVAGVDEKDAVIRIIECKTVAPKKISFFNKYSTSDYILRKYVSSHPVTEKKYLDSVGRGAKHYLKRAVTVSAAAKISTEVSAAFFEVVEASVAAEYGLSFSGSVEEGYEFVGPDESLQYNSRVFYVGVYNDRGYYKIHRNTPSGKNDVKTVHFTAPVEKVIWSLDRKIY